MFRAALNGQRHKLKEPEWRVVPTSRGSSTLLETTALHSRDVHLFERGRCGVRSLNLFLNATDRSAVRRKIWGQWPRAVCRHSCSLHHAFACPVYSPRSCPWNAADFVSGREATLWSCHHQSLLPPEFRSFPVWLLVSPLPMGYQTRVSCHAGA